MNVEQIKERVAAIAEVAGDPEVAHGMEDKLLADVLGAIAAGVENPAALAEAALSVHYVAFPRWYA